MLKDHQKARHVHSNWRNLSTALNFIESSEQVPGDLQELGGEGHHEGGAKVPALQLREPVGLLCYGHQQPLLRHVQVSCFGQSLL